MVKIQYYLKWPSLALIFIFAKFSVSSCSLINYRGMKRIFCLWVFVVFSSLMVVFASAEDRCIRSLQGLYEEIEQNYESYTEEDWDKVKAKYEKINKKMEDCEFTDEQLREIGKLKGKCSAYMSKDLFNKVGKGLIEIGGVVEGFMEELRQMPSK